MVLAKKVPQKIRHPDVLELTGEYFSLNVVTNDFVQK